MKVALLAFVLFLSLLAQHGAAQVADADELAIYRVLFKGMKTIVLVLPDPKKKPSVYYRFRGRELAQAHSLFKKDFPQLDDATISYYLDHGPHPALLTPKSDVGVKMVFLEHAKFDAICASGTDSIWTPFKKRFPGATIVYTSKFQFDADKTQALVSILWSLDADIRKYLLEKRNGKWVIEQSKLIMSLNW